MVLWTVNFTSFASKIYCLFLSVLDIISFGGLKLKVTRIGMVTGFQLRINAVLWQFSEDSRHTVYIRMNTKKSTIHRVLLLRNITLRLLIVHMQVSKDNSPCLYIYRESRIHHQQYRHHHRHVTFIIVFTFINLASQITLTRNDFKFIKWMW